MPYPEQSLAGRLLKNDLEALEQAIRWIAAALTSSRFWSLRGEWSDLMQESLARVVESLRLERFDASRDFRVYVQGIARFVCLQALDRRAQQLPSANPGGAADEAAVNPEGTVIDRQLARLVLDAASEDCRELFRLYFFESLSYQEIAEGQQVPVGTVKSRLFRCLDGAHRRLLSSALRKRHRGQP